jgi:broad specificity phosphatase PhoE
MPLLDWGTLDDVQETGDQGELRIALVRHARSAHVHTGWIDVHGFAAWRAAYDAAGIANGQVAPPILAALAQQAGIIASSDTPRALATAKQLTKLRPIEATSLLRELELTGPNLAALRLPLPAWTLAVGLRAFLLSLQRRFPSPEELQRIHEASQWLQQLAARHRLVIAVTHGSIRREIFRHLLQCGWRPEPGPRTIRHWSAWVLRSAPATTAASRLTPRCSGRHLGEPSNVLAPGVDRLWLRSTARPVVPLSAYSVRRRPQLRG